MPADAPRSDQPPGDSAESAGPADPPAPTGRLGASSPCPDAAGPAPEPGRDHGGDDQSATDRGVAEGRVAEGGVAEGGVAEGGVAEGGVAEGGVAEGGVAEGGVDFGRDGDGGSADRGVAEGGVDFGGDGDGGEAEGGGVAEGGDDFGDGGDGGDDFEPANALEETLAGCVLSGARATLLRALARSCLVVLADLPPEYGLSSARAGEVQVPCIADTEGRHALLYTSYRQMALANRIADEASVRWYELGVAELFEHWPKDVDIWLNAGGQLGFPLDPVDISTVGDIAAGLEVDEAYEIGPDDDFTDFPGPSIPDQVDCAIVLSLFDLPEVLEVIRSFRRLEEPRGRTWRIVLVLVDREVHGEAMAQQVVEAINEASDECCEVHVAEVADDDVYEAVEHLLHIGVPLWRRDGFLVPDTLEGLSDVDITGLETGGGVPDSPESLGRDLDHPDDPEGQQPRT